MIEDITKRIDSLGYKVVEEDSWMLEFTRQKVTTHIQNQCNTKSIPEGLHEVAIDMVAGEFLFAKKSIRQLTGFDLDTAIKSIQEGDTNITFAIGEGSSTPERRLDTLIAYLMHGDTDFSSYRCIKW